MRGNIGLYSLAGRTFLPVLLASLVLCSTTSTCDAVDRDDWSQLQSAKYRAEYNQGLAFENQKLWRKSLDSFIKVVSLQPHFAPGWYELGRAYFNLNDYNHAWQCFKVASLHLPAKGSKLRECLQSLIYCETKLGRLEDIQQTRKDYLTSFAKAKDAHVVSDEIAYYQKDFADSRQAENSNSVFNPFLWRPWRAQSGLPKMPITVSVGPSKLMQASKSYNKEAAIRYSNLTKKALLAWASVTDGRLSFAFVGSPPDAQIQCEWTNNPAERDHSFSAGECGGITGSGRLPKQRPLVFLPAVRTDADFYNVSMHEIGHALGLEHSSKPQDVMYFAGAQDDTERASSLSSNDISRIRSIYVAPLEIADYALEFGKLALVEQDYESAYNEYLAEPKKKIESMEQFRQALEAPRSQPISVEINHVFIDTRHGYSHATLLGRDSKNEKSYYHIEMVSTPTGTLKVNNATTDR